MSNAITYKDFHAELIAKLMVRFPERTARQMIDWIFADSIKANPNSLAPVSEIHLEILEGMTIRLLSDEPFDYVMGHSIFYGYRFSVDPNVLIPRPETEELVEWAIQILKEKKEAPSILDIGTGSGCIAITIKKEIPEANVLAIDVSGKALDIAKQNAKDLDAYVNFRQLNYLMDANNLSQKFDLIISNPPYIGISEKEQMSESTIMHEPGIALFAEGNDPLIFYREIVKNSETTLDENGVVLMEMNEFHSEEILKILSDSHLTDIEVKKDLQGKERMISGTFKSMP